MKTRWLVYNARIHTQADGLVVDSLAVDRNRIVAVGNKLNHDSDFDTYEKIDLKGRAVVPGLVDAHTHFYYFALSFNRVNLQGLTSLAECLQKIKSFASHLKKDDWVVGEGYAPDRFERREEPTAEMLDEVTGGRPAFIHSKDQHSAWLNSRVLAMAGYTAKSKDPVGGEIVRYPDGRPTGIVREGPAIEPAFKLIPQPTGQTVERVFKQALQHAYHKGVTGVHSVDGPTGWRYFEKRNERGNLGLRINYYPPASMLDELLEQKVYYGQGDDWLRIAGVKIFSDGSLGSQTALCFNKYKGSKNNFGIEVLSSTEIAGLLRKAAKLNLPAAIHAIGDRAVDNVLTAVEASPKLAFGARHRIEHLQLVRRKDIPRIKRLGIVASVQPSHCPSDIEMIRKYWGARGRNAYIFRTLLQAGVPVAFGSDVPIEPLDPLSGIADAVRRAKPNSRDVFYPAERITAAAALHAFTAGCAWAVGQELSRGYLLPGYPADLAVLSQDITRIAPLRLYDTAVLATVLDGKVVYAAKDFSL